MKENDNYNRWMNKWMNKWNNDNSYLMAASWHQGGKLEETAQLAWTALIIQCHWHTPSLVFNVGCYLWVYLSCDYQHKRLTWLHTPVGLASSNVTGWATTKTDFLKSLGVIDCAQGDTQKFF